MKRIIRQDARKRRGEKKRNKNKQKIGRIGFLLQEEEEKQAEERKQLVM